MHNSTFLVKDLFVNSLLLLLALQHRPNSVSSVFGTHGELSHVYSLVYKGRSSFCHPLMIFILNKNADASRGLLLMLHQRLFPCDLPTVEGLIASNAPLKFDLISPPAMTLSFELSIQFFRLPSMIRPTFASIPAISSAMSDHVSEMLDLLLMLANIPKDTISSSTFSCSH